MECIKCGCDILMGDWGGMCSTCCIQEEKNKDDRAEWLTGKDDNNEV